MNEHFYMPLPVACLEINRVPLPRAARRRWQREMKNRGVNWTPGPKRQMPKRRRHRALGGFNRDKYHK